MNSLDEIVLPFFRLLGLEEYLLDPEVTELMVTNSLVFVERAGRLIEVEGLVVEDRRLRACVEIIAQRVGDYIDDYKKPWLDSRLPDGSRVAAIYPPISPQGVVLTIRKFFRHFSTAELLERGALTQESLEVILAAVQSRSNILVCGGTSTGKTTITNALVRHHSAARTHCRHRKADRNETRSEVRAEARGVPGESVIDRKRQFLSSYR